MDYTAIRHTLESLGEELAACGWKKPMQLIESNGKLGNAIRDCRDDRCVGMVKNALKGWAKEIKTSGHPRKKEMMSLMEDAWGQFKAAVNEGLEDEPGQKQQNQVRGQPTIRLRLT